jgi:exonuclease SbcD
MKILHTADWHLGKRLERFDRSAEQRAVLAEICQIADREDVDAVLIAGDLYDTFNPPIEATDNFYHHLKRLSAHGRRAVVAIAGNHDSPHRIEAPDPLARECGIIFAGYPHTEIQPFRLDTGLEVLRSAPGFIELRLPRCEAPLRLLLTPYANETRFRKALSLDHPEADLRALLQGHWQDLATRYCDPAGINVLLTHLFMMKKGESAPEEPEDEKPIHIGGAGAVHTENVPPQIQYVALGHLHRHQNMSGGPCPCVYSSSILEYSFAEAGQDKYVVIVEAEPGKPVNYRKEKLRDGRSLSKVEFEEVDEAVAWLHDNPEPYVELTIVTDSYLSGQDRKRLLDAHERIIGPIPRFRNPELLIPGLGQAADPTRSRADLFRDFFLNKKGLEPGESIMALFHEITGKEAAE